MTVELSYSFHLGSDKNKTKSGKKVAEKNISQTSSYANNAIQNAKGLSKVNKHNLRNYDNQKDDIFILYGSDNLYEDVKKIYASEFKEAQDEYNERQKRDERKIENYFEYVSKDNKKDLACEIIIELGDMDFWQEKNMQYKKKMDSVFEGQVYKLMKLLPEFKIANVVVHYDETSPHMHIVGIPIKEGYKSGMKKQVCKSKIFTKESLVKLQDKMRIDCIERFNKVYEQNVNLKPKQKGRNFDIKVSEMKNYRTLKLQENEKKQRFVETNKKIDNLGKETKKINDILNELKPNRVNKKSSIISNDSVERIRKYGANVLETVKSMKSVEELNDAIKDVEKDLNNHKNQINDLNWTIHNLNYQIGEKDEEIHKLNKKLSESVKSNVKLKNELNSVKEAFSKVRQVLKNMFKRFKNKIIYDKDENYINVVKDLKNSGVLTDDDSDMILNPQRKVQTPDEKILKDKKKNDFELK